MKTPRTAVAAAAALGVLLLPSAASAATHAKHPSPSSHGTVKHPKPGHPAPKHKPAAKKKPAAAAAVHVEGLVLRHSGASVTVHVRQGTVGRASVAHRVITFALPRGSKVTRGTTGPATPIIDGSAITIVGSQSGKGGAVVRTASVAPAPAGVLVGLAAGAHGSSLVVTASRGLDGDRDEALDGAAFVDTSRASVTVDGVTAPLSQVPSGAYVVVLGERDGDVVVASSVRAYAAAPAVAVGTVASVDGATVTLAADEQGDDGGEDGGEDGSADAPKAGAVSGAVVDTTAATVLLDGVASTGSALAAGDRVLALGAPDDAGVLHAAVVLAFDDKDHGPAPFARHGHDD